MSVKPENRYRKLVIKQGREIDDQRREMEAAYMPRQPRMPVPISTPIVMSRSKVRAWMRREAAGYAESATMLAEAANSALVLPKGAMDDETHWVWEDALAAVERVSA